jgi:peptidoglycan hydrolase-like protein with peptidoglycan-binding domain
MAFDEEALKGITAEAERLSVEWQALAAVADVESGGRPLWDGLCPIRIEGHYFYARLSGGKRDTAVAQGLASPKAGAVSNGPDMAARYAKLDRMRAIDENAALESCSWGLGQVMGAHWKSLGYESVKALADDARDSVAGQVRLMGRFIEHNGLIMPLRKKDWPTFALLYNGKGYKKNSYDTKMANAYARFSKGTAPLSGTMSEKNVIERGNQGAKVKDLQQRLSDLGYYKGTIDGKFGGGTETAVMDFQRDALILVDGRAGPATQAKLAGWTQVKAADTTTGTAEVVYKNQHAIRNRPCTSNLEQRLAQAVFAVYGPGMQAQIYSGGQPRLGSPGKRTGSIRHDDYGLGGRALDAYIVKPNGERLTGLDLARLGQYWLAKGYGGCGLEMAVGGIHLDEWTTPPEGGGMYWTYPYSDGKPWGKDARQMLIDGSRGTLP